MKYQEIVWPDVKNYAELPMPCTKSLTIPNTSIKQEFTLLNVLLVTYTNLRHPHCYFKDYNSALS